jgi:hypothetical protein
VPPDLFGGPTEPDRRPDLAMPSTRRHRVRVSVLALAVLAIAAVVAPSSASAMASHEGWPPMHMLLMNKNDRNRPLDARPGMDPFGGKDPDYRCDSLHGTSDSCATRFKRRGRGYIVTSAPGHARLLGGHGDDVLFASPWGDVLWGDYKPSGQPTSQRDVLVGGAGPDFLYPSHGRNLIVAGAGNDVIHGHFGRGRIDCGPGRDVVYVHGRKRHAYKLKHCEVVSTKTGQSAPRWFIRQLPWS